MHTNLHSPRFLSLKWRALLLTSLVLVAVTGFYAAYGYYEFRKLFTERRELVHDQYTRQVQGLLEQSANRLRQLGTAIAALPSVQRSLSDLARNKAEGLPNGVGASQTDPELERILSILDLDLGIQTAAIFSESAAPLVAHGWTRDEGDSRQLALAAAKAMRDEAPVTLYQCQEDCIQFTAAPILDNLQSKGAVILGTSPADLILDFQRVSGSDIGLLVLNMSGLGVHAPQRWIAPWHARIMALSNAEKNTALLHHVAETIESPDALKIPVVVPYQGRNHEIRLVRLGQFEPKEQAYLVFVEDISDELGHIDSATRKSILLGATGLVVSEALLLAILWAPMSRLRRAADNLPRLAEAAYAQVRAALAGKPRRRWSRDEVDVLDDTAIALSHQLEALHREVTERTQDLSARMQELAQEKSFIAHMLDSAQALILTHDRNHDIVMANRYGEFLTGYGIKELQGKPLLSLLAHEVQEPALRAKLSELTLKRREHLEEEWDIRCKDGSTLNVVWHHSLLDDELSDGPMVLSIGMDITARKTAEHRLAWLADHDPLTRLYNRRRFQEELQEALASARRYGHGGALLFFDLDQFKYVNDTSGHRAGDVLLERLSEHLPRLLREVDVLGRIGGDEFAVILPRSTDEDAVNVAKRLLTYISQTEFSLSGRIYKVSASIGIALFPQDGDNTGDLMSRADIAMYQVKDTGRGGWHLFSQNDESHRLIQERFLWKERVEKALAEDRFMLYAQAVVDIRQGSTSHYEVLLRMKGEDGSVITPAQFIVVAERTGLIHAIDRMVLSKALHYLAALGRNGIAATFAINLSAHAFNNPDLLTHLKNLLDETRLEPSQVILEVTETAAIADINAAKFLLAAIQELGCRFALDDFGAGFSSFHYMREMPMDFVKIDGAFIRNLPNSPDDQALVVAMGQIARAFGKKTIAEQVENAETLRLLEQFDIDYSQGYFTGRPAPVETVFGIQP